MMQVQGQMLMYPRDPGATFWSVVNGVVPFVVIALNVIITILVIWFVIWFVKRIKRIDASLASIDKKMDYFLDKQSTLLAVSAKQVTASTTKHSKPQT